VYVLDSGYCWSRKLAHLKARFVWVQISFNTFVESQDSLQPWISEQIKNALELNYGHLNPLSWESLQRVYEREIRIKREGVLKPLYTLRREEYEIKIAEEVETLSRKVEDHYLRCLAFFAKQSGRQIILVFDNGDQHSPALQNEVFLLAQKHAQVLKCIAFISLREESYWKNKEFGGLSAFHPTSFQITAPRIEQVLARRFKYASKLILENSEMVAGLFTSTQLQLSPAQIDNVFRVLHHTLLGEDKRFIRFLEYMSPGEVRRALDFVARFLTSGHTNVNRILDRSSQPRTLPVGFHEFLQAVMLGDRMHFRQDLSDVVNLFSADGKGDQSHFNKLAILARLLKSAGEQSPHGAGFVSVKEVCQDCELVGMTNETTLSLIGLLTEKRLLVTETFVRDTISSFSLVRATSAAVYCITELAPLFTYLDLILMDTDIGRSDFREELNELTRLVNSETDRLKRVEIRLKRCRRFIDYLVEEFDSSQFAKAGGLFEGEATSLVRRIDKDFDSQASGILANARIAFHKK